MDLIAPFLPHLPLALLIFLAGFIDAIAGGGGLITLPAYFASGLNPALLLGTNKLSSSMGTAVAAARLFREARLRADMFFVAVVMGVVGAFMGAWAMTLVSPDAIRYILLTVLPAVGIFLAAKKNFGFGDTSSRLGEGALMARTGGIVFGVSIYDGVLGPGTGTFLALAFTRFCGYDLLRATALAKVFNLVSNLAALTVFLWFGAVDMRLGLAMGLAGMAGNYAGSHMALKRGAWVIRPMLFLVSAAMLARVAWQMLR